MKKILLSLQTKIEGDVAQLVEQRTENPCVGGSIPSITTFKNEKSQYLCWLFSFKITRFDGLLISN